MINQVITPYQPGDCPVEEGEALVYDMEIPIENFFPTIEILGRLPKKIFVTVSMII